MEHGIWEMDDSTEKGEAARKNIIGQSRRRGWPIIQPNQGDISAITSKFRQKNQEIINSVAELKETLTANRSKEISKNFPPQRKLRPPFKRT